MPRTKVEIDKSELVAVINRLETSSKFNTRTDLSNAIAKELNISPAVVLLRIKEFNIEPKTPKGKRGRQKGTSLTEEQKKAMQAGRSKSKTAINVENLRKYFPKSRSGLIDKIEKGSLTAAVKAKCLDCCSFDTNEIKNCACVSCPLFEFRPYKI